jgi:hypothetical protein
MQEFIPPRVQPRVPSNTFSVHVTGLQDMQLAVKTASMSAPICGRQGEIYTGSIINGLPASVDCMTLARDGSGLKRALGGGLCHDGPVWLFRPQLLICLCGGRHNCKSEGLT